MIKIHFFKKGGQPDCQVRPYLPQIRDFVPYSHSTPKATHMGGSFSALPRRSPFGVALLRSHLGSLQYEKISRPHEPLLKWNDYNNDYANILTLLALFHA